jgi:hypothetical protein
VAAEGVEAAEAAEAVAVEAAEAAEAAVRSGGAALACRADATLQWTTLRPNSLVLYISLGGRCRLKSRLERRALSETSPLPHRVPHDR